MINDKIFKEYFGCHISSCLTKDLYKANQAKNEQIVYQVNNALILHILVWEHYKFEYIVQNVQCNYVSS